MDIHPSLYPIGSVRSRAAARVLLERRRILRQCQASPLYWLQNCTKTRDDHWREKGTEPFLPFPKLPYMPWLFHLMQTERRLFMPKSREMTVSWAVMGYAAWLCQFRGPVECIVQTEREAKVLDLVSGRGTPGYVRTLYEQQPEWLKAAFPTAKPPQEMAGDIFMWANKSVVRGVPSGASQVRQYHPALVIYDEACFLSEWWESYGAAEPVSSQIIAVSSANPSRFGDLVEDARAAGQPL